MTINVVSACFHGVLREEEACVLRALSLVKNLLVLTFIIANKPESWSEDVL